MNWQWTEAKIPMGVLKFAAAVILRTFARQQTGNGQLVPLSMPDSVKMADDIAEFFLEESEEGADDAGE